MAVATTRRSAKSVLTPDTAADAKAKLHQQACAKAISQTIITGDAKAPTGQLSWHVADPAEGVMQVLSIWVRPEHQRQGVGSELLTRAIALAKQQLAAQGSKLRKVIVLLGHERDIIARAFLTRHGFHHVHTMKGLLKDQDWLGYVKSYD
jgi:ribosomal protein S18 acetylase RimI-like enzyme